MLMALLLAAAGMRLTIDAPREMAGATLLVDGGVAGVLGRHASATVIVPPGTEHTLIVRARHYATITKRFHGGVASLRVRVLRDEVEKTSAGGACRCVRGDYATTYGVTSIFRGRVIAIDPIPPEKQVSELRTRITFQTANKRVAVSTWEVDGPYCGLSFQRGVEYLVFAWGRSGALLTDACTRTRPVAEAADDLRWLRDREPEPRRTTAKLDARDAAVIAAALRPPRDYDYDAPDALPPAIAPKTIWYRFRQDIDELAERMRMDLEERASYAEAGLVPQLIPAFLARNDRYVAGTGNARGPANVTLPVYDASGTVAVLYIEIDRGAPSNPAAFVILRRQRIGWRAVAWTR